MLLVEARLSGKGIQPIARTCYSQLIRSTNDFNLAKYCSCSRFTRYLYSKCSTAYCDRIFKPYIHFAQENTIVTKKRPSLIFLTSCLKTRLHYKNTSDLIPLRTVASRSFRNDKVCVLTTCDSRRLFTKCI